MLRPRTVKPNHSSPRMMVFVVSYLKKPVCCLSRSAKHAMLFSVQTIKQHIIIAPTNGMAHDCHPDSKHLQSDRFSDPQVTIHS